MLANRVSYFFDLRGPSMTIDTACSSGIVALHEACKSIRDGEVTQALVGGANLILDPDQTAVMSSMS
jgi:emericellamide synthase (highly reducing iterative type I polyketide synthase)